MPLPLFQGQESLDPDPRVLKTKGFMGIDIQGAIYDFAKSLTDDEQLGTEIKSDGQVKLLKNEEKNSSMANSWVLREHTPDTHPTVVW